MYLILLIVYLLLVVALIGIILMQEPRTSGGLGIAFGGGVENILGVKSAPTVFTKITVGMGVAFGLLAFLLSMMSGSGRTSVVIKEAGKGTVYKLLQEIQTSEQTPQQPTTPQNK